MLWVWVYLPPDRTREVPLAESFARSLSKICSAASPADDILIIGDFNLPSIKWSRCPGNYLFPDPAHSSLSVFSSTLLDAISSATLRQINNVENENDRMLDLCFVNETDRPPHIERAPAPLVKEVPHHPALLLSLEMTKAVNFINDVPTFRLDFANSNYEAIFDVLASIDWEREIDILNSSEAAVKLSNILNYCIDRHVPKRVTNNNYRVPWFSKRLSDMKTLKKKALRNYTKFRSAYYKEEYRKLNSAYKKASHRCYGSYLNRTQRNLKCRPKSFWKHVNDQRKESGLPSRMFLGSECADSSSGICKLFAEKFSSTFIAGSVQRDQITAAANNVPLLTACLNSIRIEENAILKAASKLKGSLTPGPDGIPATFLKRCVRHLLVPIRMIFQLSLDSSSFPLLWKEAFMFPIHKKGDRRDANNYRGISALCAIAKLFELVVFDPIYSHCEQYFSTNQHGFLPKRSTTTNLLEFTSSVQANFAIGSQTDAIYTDLSAAFDKVNHDITIAKLSRLGFCGSLLKWFNSYLTGRKLTVRINNSLSKPFSASSGVPQGSHLGPILFLLYFNDALLLLDGFKLSYADDLKLYRRIENLDDVNSLQQQFCLFARWCDLNCLPLNVSKCAVISFTRKRRPLIADYFLGGQIISRVDHIKDLGVILDQQLDFKLQTNYVIDKASRCLGFIFRMAKDFKDVYCLKSLYCCLVRSTLEYASAVWCPYYQNGVDRIEAIQRRFIRFALRRLNWQDPFHLPSYESRCRLIHLDTLQARRSLSKALLVRDILASRVDCPNLLQMIQLNVPTRGLRNRNLRLYAPFRRNNYGVNSAMLGVISTFNRFSEYFDFHISREDYKMRVLCALRRL